MTKQDYELIASILGQYRGLTRAIDDLLDDISEGFAIKFAEQNDRFDYDRFIKATR